MVSAVFVAGRRWDPVELTLGHTLPAADISAARARRTGGAMELYHDGVRLGSLTRHFYETPWASAWLVADDPATVARYATICAFHAWCEQLPDDLSHAEADARYEQELAARGLDEAQLDAYWRPWVVVMPNGERREITPPHVEPDGYLIWRW